MPRNGKANGRAHAEHEFAVIAWMAEMRYRSVALVMEFGNMDTRGDPTGLAEQIYNWIVHPEEGNPLGSDPAHAANADNVDKPAPADGKAKTAA